MKNQRSNRLSLALLLWLTSIATLASGCWMDDQAEPAQINACETPDAASAHKEYVKEALRTKQAPEHVTVGVFIDDGDYMTGQMIADSCAFWDNVDCFSSEYETADLKVQVNHAECVLSEDGNAVLGELLEMNLMCGQQAIVLNAACIELEISQRATAMTADEVKVYVLAHEIGHALGLVGRHIPIACDGSNKDHPIFKDADGQPVCGKALMNPSFGTGIKHQTSVDAQFFSVRSTGYLFPTGKERFSPEIRASVGSALHGGGCRFLSSKKR